MNAITLTHDEFERVCDHFALMPRRGANRMEVRMPATIATYDAGETGPPMKTNLRDLSLRGATLLHKGEMPLGAHVVILLEARRLITRIDNVKRFVDGSTMVMLSHVKYIEPMSAGAQTALASGLGGTPLRAH